MYSYVLNVCLVVEYRDNFEMRTKAFAKEKPWVAFSATFTAVVVPVGIAMMTGATSEQSFLLTVPALLAGVECSKLVNTYF